MRNRDEENFTPDERQRDQSNNTRGAEVTADEVRDDVVREQTIEREQPAQRMMDALFADADRTRHQKRWESIQTGFVDDPRRAVQEADALVAELTEQIQSSFGRQRERLETSLAQGGEASTEDLRRTLQQYRAFFTRLLSM